MLEEFHRAKSYHWPSSNTHTAKAVLVWVSPIPKKRPPGTENLGHWKADTHLVIGFCTHSLLSKETHVMTPWAQTYNGYKTRSLWRSYIPYQATSHTAMKWNYLPSDRTKTVGMSTLPFSSRYWYPGILYFCPLQKKLVKQVDVHCLPHKGNKMRSHKGEKNCVWGVQLTALRASISHTLKMLMQWAFGGPTCYPNSLIQF